MVTPIEGFCNCSMFCCALLCYHSSLAIILMGKRELVALLCLSSWCLVIVAWLFLTMAGGGLQFVIVVFPTLFMFCDLHVSLKYAFAGGYKFDEFALFDFGFGELTHQILGILVFIETSIKLA